MSSWIVNIIGMVFVGVILEVILPTGKTNAFIKMVFAIFLLYVIVMPLPKLFNGAINLNNSTATVTDTNYLINLNLQKVSMIENEIIKKLAENGFEEVSVIISSNIYSENLEVHKIHIDLINLVLKNKDKHININKEITNIITSIINIKEENILIYGK